MEFSIIGTHLRVLGLRGLDIFCTEGSVDFSNLGTSSGLGVF